ncbi:hypothetical protein [Streptomyces griseoviridis]|uniref:Uncharacterized protein n=1 Tax=Streptomyces griseoviridis TaxID=45398 RepID=A0ABT9LIU0_STRGD|nr:hypothetical protein [Streptomyces griseoviridis]MDP9683634.1 hypothetical protein [Streptomyces griseoviridis]
MGIAVPAQPLPAPVGGDEGDGPVGPPHGGAAPSAVAPGPAAASVARGRGGTPSGAAGAVGPVGVHGVAYSGTSDLDIRRPAAGGGRTAAPVPHAPAGDPDGTLDASAAADHGTPRHADASAVALSTRIPQVLVAGSVVRADASDIRDRYRDVLVPPA